MVPFSNVERLQALTPPWGPARGKQTLALRLLELVAAEGKCSCDWPDQHLRLVNSGWQTRAFGFVSGAVCSIVLALRCARLKHSAGACADYGRQGFQEGAGGWFQPPRGCGLPGPIWFYTWLEAGALVVSAAGLVVVLWGWPMLRRKWPAIAYLVFMLPLPYRVEVLLSHPLRGLATKVSTRASQNLRVPGAGRGKRYRLAGWLIMPLGMLLVWLEVWFLSRLFIRRKPSETRAVVLGVPAGLQAATAAVGAGVERNT